MAIRLNEVGARRGDYASLDDKMLVLDFQAGDPGAFVEIYRRYAPLAKHVCRRFLVTSQDSEEAFQETMIRVFQGLFRFNGQFALQPWIARIATNVSIDQIRARGRRPSVDDATLEEHEREDVHDGPEQLVERLFERDLVLSVLADLPESHRTALILRELEGRSHKEIADHLGITTGQAKALIHRAKGSFRRSWLLRMTERTGVAGLALAPIAAFLKLTDGLRRTAERVTNVGSLAPPAATELLTTATAAGAPTTSALLDRAVAAGVTLLLAGGVTVGAVSVANHRGDRAERAEAVAISAAPAPVVAAAPSDNASASAAPVVRPTHPDRQDAPASDRARHVPVLVDPSPSSTVTPTPEPSDTPSADPTEDTGSDPGENTTPDPTASPPPAIPPAPTWAFSFTTGAHAAAPCGCDTTARLVASEVRGDAESGYSVSESVEGVALDAGGTPAWTLSLDLRGSAGGQTGAIDLSFVLGASGETTAYVGTANQVSVSSADNADAFRFEGTYSTDPEVPADGRPVSGAVTITLGIWADGTPYVTSVSLS